MHAHALNVLRIERSIIQNVQRKSLPALEALDDI